MPLKGIVGLTLRGASHKSPLEKREFFSETSFEPIHYYLYQPIVIYIAPFIKNLGISPNQITLARIPLVVLIVYICLYKSNLYSLILSCLLILLLGLMDDLDGYIARKYDMKTEIGRTLDVLVDFLTFLAILFIAYKKLGKTLFIKYIIPLVILTFAYKIREKELISKGKKYNDLVNIFTHIFILYIIILISLFGAKIKIL